MRKRVWIISMLLVLILAFAGCTAPGTANKPATTAAPSPSPVAPVQSPGSLATIEEAVESIYAQVNPSVVNIQVVQKPSPSTFPGIPGLPGTPPQFSGALGSGFVWDSSGRIVTNNHVVSGADTISVTFYDGTTVPAAIVGTDSDSDLAVIKVDATARQLQPVKMADSTQLKVGQLAIAIGNPFGLQGTLTVGYVSGLGRLLPTNQSGTGPSYNIPDVIQTDAALNPGNSGGVLLNDAGMVIGVTSAIESTAGASAGVGFAIPSAIVQRVVPALITTGHYDHAWIGITGTSLTPDLAKAMNLNSTQRGALVEDVTANSPAAKAGLRASDQPITVNGQPMRVGGDVIVGVDSQTVKSFDDLIAYLALSTSAGQTITLTVLRDAKEVQVPLTLAARPQS